MKFSEFKRYFTIFILAVAIIAVYKTFDNLAGIFSAIGSFFSLLSPVIYAFVIAFLLYPICEKTETFIENRMHPFFQKRARSISVLLVYIFVFLIIGSIVYMTLPAVINSFIEFLKMIPVFVENLVNKLNSSRYIYIDLKSLDKYIDFQKFLSDSGWLNMGVYTSKIMSLSVNFANIILSVITSIYILLDRKSLVKTASIAVSLFNKNGRLNFAGRYIRKAIDFSYKYMFCILLDGLIVFVISLIILLIMGIDHALVLALMLGLFNLVPYFGSLIACVITVLITIMTANLSTALILAVILLALQQVDGNIIQPHLVKDSLDVRPFWVLVGIFVGGGLFGLWGIVLAVPVMALLKTVATDYLAYRNEK